MLASNNESYDRKNEIKLLFEAIHIITLDNKFLNVNGWMNLSVGSEIIQIQSGCCKPETDKEKEMLKLLVEFIAAKAGIERNFCSVCPRSKVVISLELKMQNKNANTLTDELTLLFSTLATNIREHT